MTDNELVEFFGAGWDTPWNRRTLAGARALAAALEQGGTRPRIISRKDGFREFARAGGTYTTTWQVGFETPPPDGVVRTSSMMSSDALFGRGDSRASARIKNGVLEIYAEQ